MKKENLLVITPYLNRTGSSDVLKEAINNYSLNYNVIIYTYEKNPDTSNIEQYKKIFLAPSSLNLSIFYLFKLINKIIKVDLDWIFILLIIKSFNIGAIHINTLLFANTAKKIAGLGIPFNLHIHEHVNRYFLLPGRNLLDQFKYANKIFVPSKLIKKGISHQYQLKTSVYYSIPSIELFESGNKLIEMWSQYKLKKYDFVWVTSGSFIQSKGIQFLLEILHFLNTRNASLLWLGYVYDDGYTLYLKEKLREEKLTNLILPGNMEKPLYYSILANCDAFLSLSHYESYGLSILEAYLLGLPIVSFEEIGVKELLTGISLIENFNLEKYKNEMMKVMNKNNIKHMDKSERKIKIHSDTSIFNFK